MPFLDIDFLDILSLQRLFVMEERADDVLEAEENQRRILRETPVYRYPARYAHEHDELEQYRAFHKANVACKEAIEASISSHYSDNRLGKQAALEVIEAFGMERTVDEDRSQPLRKLRRSVRKNLQKTSAMSAPAASKKHKLRLAIDAALAEKPKDYAAFLKLMREAGYEYKPGKQPAFRSPGQKKFTRLRSLKDGYSEGDILSIIVGKKELSPARKNAKKIQTQRVNLLVDIQAKLAEGKGAVLGDWGAPQQAMQSVYHSALLAICFFLIFSPMPILQFE